MRAVIIAVCVAGGALVSMIHAAGQEPAREGGRRGGQREEQPAQPADGPKPDDRAKGDKKDKDKSDEPVTTHHEVTINGQKVFYDATAGYMVLPSYEGKPKANIFYIAYTKTDGPPPKTEDGSQPDPGADSKSKKDEPSDRADLTRPITFCFNGGPGSSSVWLHLGAIGPRRVPMSDGEERPDEPAIPTPPYRLVENEHSWLDLSDLVFIDPVGTGYSRPVEGEQARQFQGLEEDIQSVGEFIRLYTVKHKRWHSPKFLSGESYGTTRAAGLANYLQDTHGMYLNGIVFVSTVHNFQTIRFDDGNDTPYWLYLPTFTATAWYHRKLAPDLQADLPKSLRESEQFASGEYLLALSRGDALTPEERDGIAAKLSRYTGLSKQFCDLANLRVNNSVFCKELLRDQRPPRTVGRLDSRYTGIDATGIGSGTDYDPSYAAIQGPYTAAFNQYVRSDLGYENDLVYEILTGRVQPWNYETAENRYANVASRLRSAMSKNRDLFVMFASGYYDFATPYFASDYTVTHLGLDPTLRGHVVQTYYESGHMMYVRMADLAKLKQDVTAFYAKALQR